MAKQTSSKGENKIHETPAGIFTWVDDEYHKITDQPGDAAGSFSVKSSGGPRAHMAQLRSLMDAEHKTKGK